MILISETFLGRLWERIQLLWLAWDLEIVFGLLFFGGLYFGMRWLLWRFPNYFFEPDTHEREPDP